jgi:hypothetical protein
MRAGWPHWVPWSELALYVTGWLIAARLIYRSMANDGSGEVDGESRMAAGFLAFFWPLAIPLAVAAGVVLLPTFGCRIRERRRQRDRQQAETRQWEREKLQGRIAELEHELGLANGNGKH